MVLEHIPGLIIDSIMETGLTIKCMAKGYLHGLMVGNMMENIMMIKNKVMESLHGLMGEDMKESGTMASNMDMALTLPAKVKPKKVSGKKEKE